jgi:hypothetical protein
MTCVSKKIFVKKVQDLLWIYISLTEKIFLCHWKWRYSTVRRIRDMWRGLASSDISPWWIFLPTDLLIVRLTWSKSFSFWTVQRLARLTCWAVGVRRLMNELMMIDVGRSAIGIVGGVDPFIWLHPVVLAEFPYKYDRVVRCERRTLATGIGRNGLLLYVKG